MHTYVYIRDGINLKNRTKYSQNYILKVKVKRYTDFSYIYFFIP